MEHILDLASEYEKKKTPYEELEIERPSPCVCGGIAKREIGVIPNILYPNYSTYIGRFKCSSCGFTYGWEEAYCVDKSCEKAGWELNVEKWNKLQNERLEVR